MLRGLYLEILNNFYRCLCVLQGKRDGTTEHESGAWRSYLPRTPGLPASQNEFSETPALATTPPQWLTHLSCEHPVPMGALPSNNRLVQKKGKGGFCLLNKGPRVFLLPWTPRLYNQSWLEFTPHSLGSGPSAKHFTRMITLNLFPPL